MSAKPALVLFYRTSRGFCSPSVLVSGQMVLSPPLQPVNINQPGVAIVAEAPCRTTRFTHPQPLFLDPLFTPINLAVVSADHNTPHPATSAVLPTLCSLQTDPNTAHPATHFTLSPLPSGFLQLSCDDRDE